MTCCEVEMDVMGCQVPQDSQEGMDRKEILD